MDYKLKLQQLVDYPRCRIYRNFIRVLTEDSSTRTNGNSFLFYFMFLCSMANFQTSYMKLDCEHITISPGEWIISLDDLTRYFRKRLKKDVVQILDALQKMEVIDYSLFGIKKYVRYQIRNWSKFNTVIEANAPCTKEIGFFFFPFSYVKKFIGLGKCSEMDIVLDLWLNTVYNDERIDGSDVGPVVYYRNGTGSPLIGYEELGKRWGLSKSTAGRILKKLEDRGYIKTVSFQSSYGSAIYLCSYLSTMFNISDVIIDKEEVAMSLNIKVSIPETRAEEEKDEEITTETACQNDEIHVSDEQISVPNQKLGVPKTHIVMMVKKALKVLQMQGIPCASCTRARYLLYPLSDDCKSNILLLRMIISCPDGGYEYKFDMSIEKCNESEGV